MQFLFHKASPSLRRFLVLTSVSLFLICQTKTLPVATSSLNDKFNICGWIPNRRYLAGMESFRSNIDHITLISPVWYILSSSPSGIIKPVSDLPVESNNAIVDDPVLFQLAHQNHIAIIPIIKTIDDSGTAVQHMLDGDWETHADNLVKLVMSQGYDGIEVDYESIAKSYKEQFSKFVKYLSENIHQYSGKMLVVTLPAQVSDSDAYNYREIAQVADIVKIMVYDDQWQSPIISYPKHHSTIEWMKSVLDYALSLNRIPKNKLILALPTYGYLWTQVDGKDEWNKEQSLSYTEALEELKSIDSRVVEGRTKLDDTPYFTYSQDGQTYLQFYEDAESTAPKVNYARRLGLNGVCFWYLGGEDPKLWDILG